jgi:hypothetical protein
MKFLETISARFEEKTRVKMDGAPEELIQFVVDAFENGSLSTAVSIIANFSETTKEHGLDSGISFLKEIMEEIDEKKKVKNFSVEIK